MAAMAESVERTVIREGSRTEESNPPGVRRVLSLDPQTLHQAIADWVWFTWTASLMDPANRLLNVPPSIPS
jgi:hypothetical protein